MNKRRLKSLMFYCNLKIIEKLKPVLFAETSKTSIKNLIFNIELKQGSSIFEFMCSQQENKIFLSDEEERTILIT